VNAAADWTKTRPRDEEADDPIVPGLGSAGPGGPGDVLVFIDRALYPDAPHDAADPSVLTLTLRDAANLSESPFEIVELSPTQRVRPDRVEMRDYDFRRPLLVLESRAAATQATGVPLEVYNHHGQYEKPEINAQLAQVELEQHRADSMRYLGQGPCPRLLPGQGFRLDNAATPDLPHERYATVSVRHESMARGSAGTGAGPTTDALLRAVAQAIATAAGPRGEVAEPEIRRLLQRSLVSAQGDREYWARFECVPAETALRPPRPERAPRHVTEVAVVVGPPGKDIHTDRYGRIKIQFNWDRQGQWKETSSCWVRVVQPWAGTGFGFQFIPRVGMEVLVTFLAGDPDRPVVLGSLYNATHATPEPLPQRMTRSGIRSQSTPNGGGFNELSFEDQAGVERIHLHAQKDLHEIVNDTHRAEVHDKLLSVGRRMDVGVAGDQRWGVGGSRSDTVGKDAFERVGGNLTSDVYANRTDRVHGSALSTVDGMALRQVKTDDASVIEGNLDVSVHGDMITQVGGRTTGENSHAVTFVQGSSVLTATERVLIKAEKADGAGAKGAVRLECGESYIEIGPDKITLRAKQIDVLSSETTHVRGASSALALGGEGAALSADPIRLTTPDGSELALDAANATLTGPSGSVVQGGSVALKSGQGQGQTRSEEEQPTKKLANLTLVFSHLRRTIGLHRIAETRCRIVADDLVIEADTDPEGKVSVQVPEKVRVVYVVLWANETYGDLYPLEEGPLHWLLRIQPGMNGVCELPGARVRLRNLGYEPGTALDDEEMDGPTRAALLEFQIDQRLPATGELDDATKEKLFTVYGS
jgi:type VI secretion system secreted protein VgrG